MTLIKSYNELCGIESFRDRYAYLRIGGNVGTTTFGYDRYLNQKFYKSRIWLDARDTVIIRDNGCDLGMPGYEIGGRILVHHINPISINDILACTDKALDPNFLICVSVDTHLAIHYADDSLLPRLPLQRRPNDMAIWLGP